MNDTHVIIGTHRQHRYAYRMALKLGYTNIVDAIRESNVLDQVPAKYVVLSKETASKFITWLDRKLIQSPPPQEK